MKPTLLFRILACVLIIGMFIFYINHLLNQKEHIKLTPINIELQTPVINKLKTDVIEPVLPTKIVVGYSDQLYGLPFAYLTDNGEYLFDGYQLIFSKKSNSDCIINNVQSNNKLFEIYDFVEFKYNHNIIDNINTKDYFQLRSYFEGSKIKSAILREPFKSVLLNQKNLMNPFNVNNVTQKEEVYLNCVDDNEAFNKLKTAIVKRAFKEGIHKIKLELKDNKFSKKSYLSSDNEWFLFFNKSNNEAVSFLQKIQWNVD